MRWRAGSWMGGVILLVVSLAAFSTEGAPPPMPFVCAQARGPVEDLICVDEEFSHLRRALAVQWGAALVGADTLFRESLSKGQHRWAGFVGRRCTLSPQREQFSDSAMSRLACLTPFYYERLNQLTRNGRWVDTLGLLLPEVSRAGKALGRSMGQHEAMGKEAHKGLEKQPLSENIDSDNPPPQDLERLASNSLAAGLNVQDSWIMLATAIENQRIAARYMESAGAYYLAYKGLARQVMAPSLTRSVRLVSRCEDGPTVLARVFCQWSRLLKPAKVGTGYRPLEDLLKPSSDPLARSVESTQLRSMAQLQYDMARVLVKAGRTVAANIALKAPPLAHTKASAARVLTALISDYGLHAVRVDSELFHGQPQICVTLSADLPSSRALDYSQYLTLSPPTDHSVNVDGHRLCVSGVRAGENYEVTLRRGLPARTGATLSRTFREEVSVPDLAPSIRFPGNGYVMPRVGSRGLPIATINTASVALQILRISDRNIIHQKYKASLLEEVSPWQLRRLIDREAQLVWAGDLEVETVKNKTVITAIPIEQVIVNRRPGFYLVVANGSTVQWVVISDLALITYLGDDGLLVLVRSLHSGLPVADVEVALYSRNNHVLTRARSDESGQIRFDPGWVRGEGGNRVESLMAFGEAGDFAYLSLTRPAFDLADRGVGGREFSGPVDGLLYTERGLYRPGETIHLTGIIRTQSAQSYPNLPLSVLIVRPDGVIAEKREVLTDAAGVFGISIHTSFTDRTGQWRVMAQLAEGAGPIAQVDYQLNDFVPPRIDVALEPDASVLQAHQSLGVRLRANFLYGPPAGGLRCEAQAVLEHDRTPFAGYEAYAFGLAQERFTPRRQAVTVPKTSEEGGATFTYRLERVPQTTLPLKVTLQSTVFEQSGRPVNQELVLPIRRDDLALGIKPVFNNGRVGADKDAAFDLITLDARGELANSKALSWVLYEEVRDYFWYTTEQGQWQWRYATQDRHVAAGTLTTTADGAIRLEVKPDSWGYFRLEVSDEVSAMATSVRFEAGWTSSPVAEKSPDHMLVRLDKDSYRVGQTALVRLEAPFAGEVILSVLSNKVHLVRQLSIPAMGMTVPLEVGPDWGTGVYVSATALRPAGATKDKGPLRALGLSWLAVNTENRKLKVAIAVPEQIRPNRTIEIPVLVTGLQPGPARLTLAAVDEGVLQFTHFKMPNPEHHFFAKRHLGIDMRDVYGRLINARQGRRGVLRSGAGMASLVAGPPKRSSKVVSLFSGVLALSTEGRASVKMKLPEFNGRLRLMAVVAGRVGVGSAQATLRVREPVVATLDIPRFMAPGDSAEIGMTFALTDGPPGRYTYALQTEGPLSVQNHTLATGTLLLTAGQRSRKTLFILATDTGNAALTLTVDGPGDVDTMRHYELAVRAPATRLVERSSVTLKPGKSLTLGAKLLSGFNLNSTTLRFTASNAMGLDTTSLLNELSLYPYGCLEQTTSRAMGLLYYGALSEAANSPRLVDHSVLSKKIKSAAARIASLQRNDGSFGLWDATSPTEPWLSVYALDFLTRAEEAGFDINRHTVQRAFNWLSRYVSVARTDTAFSVIAPYGAYMLARSGQLQLSDLRYLFDTLSQQPSLTALGRSQFSAALSLLGDSQRAETALGPSERDLGEQSEDMASYHSYGSSLRDLAARLSFLQEAGDPLEQSGALVRRIAALWTKPRYLSTQTQSWLLLAAHAAEARPPPHVAVNGLPLESQEGKVSYQFDIERLSEAATIQNVGDRETYIVLTRSGTVMKPQPPLSAGFTIERVFLDFEGARVDLTSVQQNDLLVAVITGKAKTNLRQPSRVLVVDLLPAGFELENEAFNNGASTNQLDWLVAEPLSPTDFQALRDDRYVGAMTLDHGDSFRLAYVVRAVTPGRYLLPNVHIEDMYVPSLNARNGAGKVQVVSVD